MLQILRIALGLFVCSLIGARAESPIIVARSGSEEVDGLVSQLVSRTPAPHPGGAVRNWERPILERSLELGIFATPEVRKAKSALLAIGPEAFYYLAGHRDDKRFSYGIFYPTSPPNRVWINRTVGDVVNEVLSNDLESHWSYGVRKNGKGLICSHPSFELFMKSFKNEPFVVAVKDWTREQVDLAYIDFCIAFENERGFEDAEQKMEILSLLQMHRDRVEDKGRNQPKTRSEAN